MEHDFNDAALRGMLNERVKLAEHIQEVTEQMRALEQAIAERKRMFMSVQEQATDIPVTRDEYLGIKLRDAARNYLAKRGGGPVKLAKIGADLLIGGVKLGTSKRKPGHHVSIMATSGKNRDIFVFDKESQTVSLQRGAVTPKPPGRVRGTKP